MKRIAPIVIVAPIVMALRCLASDQKPCAPADSQRDSDPRCIVRLYTIDQNVNAEEPFGFVISTSWSPELLPAMSHIMELRSIDTVEPAAAVKNENAAATIKELRAPPHGTVVLRIEGWFTKKPTACLFWGHEIVGYGYEKSGNMVLEKALQPAFFSGGDYTLTAQVWYEDGLLAESAPVVVHVKTMASREYARVIQRFEAAFRGKTRPAGREAPGTTKPSR